MRRSTNYFLNIPFFLLFFFFLFPSFLVLVNHFNSLFIGTNTTTGENVALSVFPFSTCMSFYKKHRYFYYILQLFILILLGSKFFFSFFYLYSMKIVKRLTRKIIPFPVIAIVRRASHSRGSKISISILV